MKTHVYNMWFFCYNYWYNIDVDTIFNVNTITTFSILSLKVAISFVGCRTELIRLNAHN